MIPCHTDFVKSAWLIGIMLLSAPADELSPEEAAYRVFKRQAESTCDNWGFDDGLTCWEAEGDAFERQPLQGDRIVASRVRHEMTLDQGGVGGDYWRDLPYPIGQRGKGWIGTAEIHGDEAKGVLRSRPFFLRSAYVDFLIAGGRTDVKVALEIPVAECRRLAKCVVRDPTDDGWVELAHATGIGSEVMRRAHFFVPRLVGLSAEHIANVALIVARLTIRDAASDPMGHLNVDDFRFGSTAPVGIEVVDQGEKVLRDPDHPVWGVADTHAHPASHLGFSGTMIAGEPTGAPETALASCQPLHGGCVPGVTQRVALFESYHECGGYPDFEGWPKFTSTIHQQMHETWIRRAYEGGVRLISMLAVTNMFVATRWITQLEGNVLGRDREPYDDDRNDRAQLEAIRAMVARNADWMEIATSPAEARRIVHQNKLAIVLGLETDNFGSFSDESYVWRDDPHHLATLVPLSRDLDEARAQLRTRIEEYRALGVRQVTPLHYVSGVFGGTATFNPYFSAVNEAFTGQQYRVEGALHAGISYRLDLQNTAVGRALAGSFTTPAEWFHTETGGHANAMGLEPRGRILFEELMRARMLIDKDHGSFRTVNSLLALAEHNDYPIMSSHTDMLALAARAEVDFLIPILASAQNSIPYRYYPTRYSVEAHQENFDKFGTTLAGNLAHEGQTPDAVLSRLSRLGGVVGPLMSVYRRGRYEGRIPATVPNDCDGSSKTWAQLFLHAIDRGNGRGVGLSTDRGFISFIAPRFGPYAAYPLKDEQLEALSIEERTRQRARQRNGVRYDSPLRGAFEPRFARFAGGGIPEGEEVVWEALAMVENGARPLDFDRTGSDAAMRELFAIGFRSESADAAALAASEIRVLGLHVVQVEATALAAFAAYRGLAPSTVHGRLAGPAQIMAQSELPTRVVTLWRAMSGNNLPLRRPQTGNRTWDVNIDGVAHYGMLPDFFQDLRNIGLDADQRSVLFASIEDYIRMWERAEGATLARLDERIAVPASTVAVAAGTTDGQTSVPIRVSAGPTMFVGDGGSVGQAEVGAKLAVDVPTEGGVWRFVETSADARACSIAPSELGNTSAAARPDLAASSCFYEDPARDLAIPVRAEVVPFAYLDDSGHGFTVLPASFESRYLDPGLRRARVYAGGYRHHRRLGDLFALDADARALGMGATAFLGATDPKARGEILGAAAHAAFTLNVGASGPVALEWSLADVAIDGAFVPDIGDDVWALRAIVRAQSNLRLTLDSGWAYAPQFELSVDGGVQAYGSRASSDRVVDPAGPTNAFLLFGLGLGYGRAPSVSLESSQGE